MSTISVTDILRKNNEEESLFTDLTQILLLRNNRVLMEYSRRKLEEDHSDPDWSDGSYFSESEGSEGLILSDAESSGPDGEENVTEGEGDDQEDKDCTENDQSRKDVDDPLLLPRRVAPKLSGYESDEDMEKLNLSYKPNLGWHSHKDLKPILSQTKNLNFILLSADLNNEADGIGPWLAVDVSNLPLSERLLQFVVNHPGEKIKLKNNIAKFVNPPRFKKTKQKVTNSDQFDLAAHIKEDDPDSFFKFANIHHVMYHDESTAGIGALMIANSLLQWHLNNKFCARCGRATEIVRSGYGRRCLEKLVCRTTTFPQTPPILVIFITSSCGRKCLLRATKTHSETVRRVSPIIGQLCPGESIEKGIQRTILTCTGYSAENVKIVITKSWPYPTSLLIGCTASVETKNALRKGDFDVSFGWFRKRHLTRLLRRSSNIRKSNGTSPANPKSISPPLKLAIFLANEWIRD